jgi:hypothetical protein
MGSKYEGVISGLERIPSRSGRLGEEKILDLSGTQTPTSRSSSPFTSRYIDYAIPAPNNNNNNYYYYYIF